MYDATPQGWDEARAWAAQQPGTSPGTSLYDEILAIYPETWEALHWIGIEKKKRDESKEVR
jgi:hypothetical protein